LKESVGEVMDWGKMKEDIMEVDFIDEDPRFKRLHLFIGSETIEKHMERLNKAKGVSKKMKDNFAKNDSESDSESEDSNILDNISEEDLDLEEW
jgi:hypothetical protein